MSIGVAILGGGIFAREEHKPAVLASSRLTLKAVWSRSISSAKTLEADPATVDLYSEDSSKKLTDLLERADINAVIIALPIPNQPEYVRQCLKAGKHVLSEKPIGPTVSESAELIQFHKSLSSPAPTWAVAENFRYLASVSTAASRVSDLGRILTFSVRTQFLVNAGGKYFETPWRKQPTHQGGFLLDGGVHFVAGLRMMFGKDHLVSVSANTAQLQPHLPPVDTIAATARTKSGAVGTISLSFGTTASSEGTEIMVGCEQGWVGVKKSKISSGKKDGETKEEEVQDERSGVPPEIRAWGVALSYNKVNKEQRPEEALADLEILEACLRSGENGGVPVELKHQNVD